MFSYYTALLFAKYDDLHQAEQAALASDAIIVLRQRIHMQINSLALSSKQKATPARRRRSHSS
jgi:hypothetical protein